MDNPEQFAFVDRAIGRSRELAVLAKASADDECATIDELAALLLLTASLASKAGVARGTFGACATVLQSLLGAERADAMQVATALLALRDSRKQ